MIHRNVQVILLFLAAAVSGFMAARVLPLSTPTLPGPLYAVESIIASPDGFEATLGGGHRFRIDTLQDTLNARNIVLLYPGKSVALRRQAADPNRSSGNTQCEWIIPLLEQNPDERTVARYRQLRAAGVADASLAARSGGTGQEGVSEYMQRSICAVRQ